MAKILNQNDIYNIEMNNIAKQCSHSNWNRYKSEILPTGQVDMQRISHLMKAIYSQEYQFTN